jgi:hypothetical protein
LILALLSGLHSPQRPPPLEPKPKHERRGAQDGQEAPLQTSSSFDWKITVSDAFSPDQATRDWFAIASSIWSADELHLRLVGPLPESSWYWMRLEDGPLTSWDHRARHPNSTRQNGLTDGSLWAVSERFLFRFSLHVA